jgi:predicted transcriptional regulator of viral defense system
MKYLEFKEALQDFTVFSINEIRKVDFRFHRRRLNDWQAKGYIRKIVKGYYIFSDLVINENILFEIANKIHPPSYVSLEMALAHYHLIPESTYAVTSVSSRRPCTYETPLAAFIYRKMRSDLFFGYELVESQGKHFKIAGPEKAILDYFYLNPQLNSLSDFAGLRIDASSFEERINTENMYSLLERFSQKRLRKRIHLFRNYMKNVRT